MPQCLLVELTGFASDETAMEAACALPGKNHIDAVHVRVTAPDLLGLTATMHSQAYGAMRQMRDDIIHQHQERSALAKKIYTDVCSRRLKAKQGAHKPGPLADYHEVNSLDDEILRQSRFHDLTVTARVPELLQGRLSELLMSSGKPVLIPPAKPATMVGKTVLLAWKDTPEAARAVTAAMPILSEADRVIVLSVTEFREESADGVISQLKHHGIDAQLHTLRAAPEYTADKIREAAYSFEADLIVMGAYGHSRLREWALGGATRELLNVCDISLFMAH
jgi:nucleotide-binding universal stress UspA family protein